MPAASSTLPIVNGGGSCMFDVSRLLVLLSLQALAHLVLASAMENGLVFACWECLIDIAAKKPKMSINACANDNWIGRERIHVREASQATKNARVSGQVLLEAGSIGPTRRSRSPGEGSHGERHLLRAADCRRAFQGVAAAVGRTR